MGEVMDYFIVVITTAAGLYFHWWLYVRIKRWVNRDLALSMAGSDPAKREYMLAQLAEAERQKISKKELSDWLKLQADAFGRD